MTDAALSLPELVAAGLVDAGWAEALAPVADDLAALGDFLRAETAAGRGYLPAGENVLRAFRAPLVRREGAHRRTGPVPDAGASDRPVLRRRSARAPDSAKPRQHLHRAARRPRRRRPRSTATSSAWSDAGVLLLNRVLTVRPGESGSHRGIGWERVTDCAISALVARDRPLVAILWGRDAASLMPLLAARRSSNRRTRARSRLAVDSSARSRSVGRTPCSREQGAEPVDWTLSRCCREEPAVPTLF